MAMATKSSKRIQNTASKKPTANPLPHPAAKKPANKKPVVKKAVLKTVETDASVDAFIDAITDETRRADCRSLMGIMSKATRSEPRMWGPSIVGFGRTTLTYATGRTLDWFLIGFSPRKGDLSIVLNSAFPERASLLKRFGKHKTGAACIYVKRLADVDIAVLREMVKASVAHSRAHGGGC